MNEDRIEGKMKQFLGEAKKQWAKLTDDDFTYMEGNVDKFVGRIQEAYGIGKDEARRSVDDFYVRQGMRDARREMKIPR